MSLLYPLFLAGIAAVALPILLHMIRRHTRERVPFSSLMFLRPTLPRFRSRSRLEHVLLLIVRCAVLCLLAFAFARPFLRQPAAASLADAGRRVVLLIDTSASMQRPGLWARALDEAKSVLRDAGPADRVCVMSFDQGTRTLIGFEQWETMDLGQRASITAQEIAKLSPGWSATDLGHALVTAAEAIEDDETNDGGQSKAQRQIVLISDLEQGSKLDALLAYEWPQGLGLVAKVILCQGTTNASLQLVTSRDSLAPARNDDVPDIRITNSPDATTDRFQLRWADDVAGPPNAINRVGDPDQPPSAGPGSPTRSSAFGVPFTPEGGGATSLDVYVAAGHSTVVRAPARPDRQAAAKLVLTGDDQDFDNSLYVMPELRRQVNVLYAGSDDPNDTAGMLYYLRQAFGTGKAWTSRISPRSGNAILNPTEIETAHLIVVTDPVNQQNLAPLRRYLESGKPLLLAMKSAEAATVLAGLAGVNKIEAQEAETNRYAMVGRLEFDHPLLKPFSDPRFGDFTRIHFWKYRRVDLTNCPEARVLARYDNNDPAWFEVAVGRGTLLVWTSGWQPSDSDLALSSKFVPLLYGALEYGGALATHQAQYFVGDPVPLPNQMLSEATDIQIHKPDGSTVNLGGEQQIFAQTDLPGIYSISDSTRSANPQSAIRNPQFFAVNLSAAESRTDPMPIEDLEKLGVTLKPTAAVVSDATRLAARHNSFSEMESQQKLWRWVLVVMFLLLLIETWLGGWLTRSSPSPEREPI